MTSVARVAIGAVLVLVVAMLPAPAVASSTSLRYDQWSAAGIVLSQGKSSNAVAFWQNLIKSWHPSICVDGIFGTQTWIHTHGFQTNVANVWPHGVVGPLTWNGTQYTKGPGGFPRLQPVAGLDNWSYYGGSSVDSFLVKRTWGGVYQWGFRKPQTSAGTMHSSQTTTRTVSGC